MTLDGIAARLKRAGIDPDAARHEAMLLIERFCGDLDRQSDHIVL